MVFLGSVGSRPSTIQRNPFTQAPVGSREALLSREALIEEQRLKRVLGKPEPPAAHITNRLLAHQVRGISCLFVVVFVNVFLIGV